MNKPTHATTHATASNAAVVLALFCAAAVVACGSGEGTTSAAVPAPAPASSSAAAPPPPSPPPPPPAQAACKMPAIQPRASSEVQGLPQVLLARAKPSVLAVGSTARSNAGACTQGSAGVWLPIHPPELGTLPAGQRISAASLALDPFLPGVLWSADERGGMHLSPDCGNSWIRTNEGNTYESNPVHGSANWSIAVDHVQQGVVFLSAGYGAEVVFRTRDWGQTWVNTMDPPPGSPAPAPEFRFTNNVTMDPEDHLHLITTAHTSCRTSGNCVLETWDGGDNWRRKDSLFGWEEGGGARILRKDAWINTAYRGTALNNVDTHAPGGGNDQFSNALFLPGPDGAYYLAGTGGVTRSKDCGASWENIDAGNLQGLTARTMSDKKLFVGGQWNFLNSRVKWAAFNTLPEDASKPMTFADLPEIPGLQAVGGVFFLAYDQTNNILFASTEAGIFRMKIPQ